MDPDKELVFYCYAGITACTALLGAEIAGYGNTFLYDGSWSDWIRDSSDTLEKNN